MNQNQQTGENITHSGKRNSRHAVNELLPRFLTRGKKADEILREYIRKIILEELNYLINQHNQQQSEIPSIDTQKPPVLILNNYRKLTAREIEVMDLVLLGLTNRKIALRLKMELSTVKNHIKSINKNFGVTERKSTCSAYRKLYNKTE